MANATTTTTTTTAAKAWAPDAISSYGPDDMLGDALIVQAATKAGTVDGDNPKVLVPYVSADPAAVFVAEGAEIPRRISPRPRSRSPRSRSLSSPRSRVSSCRSPGHPRGSPSLCAVP